MKNTYYSIVTKNDFIKYKPAGVNFTESQPTTNQFTFNTAEQAVHINSGTKYGSFLIPVGELNVGDVIDLECEIYNISGNKGRVTIYDETGAVTYKNSNKTGEYERVKIKYVVTKQNTFRVATGVLTDEVGEIKIRNFSVNISSIQNKKPYRQVQVFTTAIGEFAVKSGRNNDPCTLTVSGVDLTITFDEPLLFIGIPIVSNEFYGNSKNYMFKVSNATENSVVIRAFSVDTAQATAIDLTTLPTATYFNLLFLG